MDRFSFTGFADELCGIRLEKDAGIAQQATSWLKGQVGQLNLAAGQAMHSPLSHSPITGQPSVPIAGTIKNFFANKLPSTAKPPGPIASRAQKLLSSKPLQHILPIADQVSEFAKLANEHYIEHCSCGNIISQCRCKGPHEKRVTPNGCVECRGGREKVDREREEEERHLLEKLAQVKPYQQKTQYSCSAACLKAVLEHWGSDRHAEHEVMHEIGVRDKGGAEVDQITEGAKKLGFDAYDKCFSSMDEAKKITDRDIPIIADFQSFNNPGKGHYVVITKIEDDVVHLMDPNTDGNERIITRAECEKRWWDRTMAPPHKLIPKWGVVVTPKGTEKTANAIPRWTALGAGLGGLGGAYRGYKHNIVSGKAPEPGKERMWSSIRSGIGGAVTGGIVGHSVGGVVNAARSLHPPSMHSSPTPVPFKGIHSKTEAKARWRDLARQHHPDAGGDVEKFKQLHSDWEKFKEHRGWPKKPV